MDTARVLSPIEKIPVGGATRNIFVAIHEVVAKVIFQKSRKSFSQIHDLS